MNRNIYNYLHVVFLQNSLNLCSFFDKIIKTTCDLHDANRNLMHRQKANDTHCWDRRPRRDPYDQHGHYGYNESVNQAKSAPCDGRTRLGGSVWGWGTTALKKPWWWGSCFDNNKRHCHILVCFYRSLLPLHRVLQNNPRSPSPRKGRKTFELLFHPQNLGILNSSLSF